jgi:hypothetical protein
MNVCFNSCHGMVTFAVTGFSALWDNIIMTILMVILLKETSNFYYGALWKPCTETKVFTHRWPAVYMYFYTTQQNVFTLKLRSLSVAINQI